MLCGIMGTGCSGVGPVTERAGVEEVTAGRVSAKVVKIITDHPTALVENASSSSVHAFGKMVEGGPSGYWLF